MVEIVMVVQAVLVVVASFVWALRPPNLDQSPYLGMKYKKELETTMMTHAVVCVFMLVVGALLSVVYFL